MVKFKRVTKFFIDLVSIAIVGTIIYLIVDLMVNRNDNPLIIQLFNSL